MKNVGFGQSLLLKPEDPDLNFSLLTRYLVLNEVTGAVYQFRFQMDPHMDKEFYPRPPREVIFFKKDVADKLKKLKEGILCEGEREDTVAYIRWYIKYAYNVLGKQRKVNASPYSDLCVMFEFWQQGFNAQDTKVICTEIEQKFLFDEQVKLLSQDITMCMDDVQPHTLMMVREGLWFHEERDEVANGHIRMLFIDVLTRRFLLRSQTMLTVI